MPTRRPASAPASRTRPAAKAAAKPVFRFRARVTCGSAIAIGPGKIALLEAIERAGSITAAAKSLDMSYRRAWLLLDEVNQSLRELAVNSAQGGERGGGSTLTAAGRRLIEIYRRIETKAQASCGKDIKALVSMLARA